jgi:RNA polymerase sigma-70 factor (ECF subfamily)
VTAQAEIVFRREWGRAVAVVTRLTGDLSLAEDAVQEAFASAVGRWASGPPPTDPSGWLITVAKNHAMDRLRREARRSGKEQAAMLMLSQRDPAPPPGRIADDQLRLIFACCHPALDPGTRVALTLRTLCGLSTAARPLSAAGRDSRLPRRRGRGERHRLGRDRGPVRRPGPP